MGPSFNALPQSDLGRINENALRFLVHNFFMQRHGWFIKGLDPVNAKHMKESVLGDEPTILSKDKVPFTIEVVLDTQRSDGFDLSSAVALVSVLEYLILDEGIASLEESYFLNGFAHREMLSVTDLDKVFECFLLIFAVGNRRAEKWNVTRQRGLETAVRKNWPSWADRDVLVHDIVRNELFRMGHLVSPFTDTLVDFEVASRIMSTVTGEFSKMHNQECKLLKNELITMDHSADGRVPLKHFWAKKFIGESWHLQEPVEYLRHLGVLDETVEARGPQVIIANYVSSLSNCGAQSDYFAVCCLRECEGVLLQLEDRIEAPAASAHQILTEVSDISSSTVLAPRNLSTQLVEALEQVASFHGGKVPLHGRLLAQWLHYAFPHECPYPYMSHKHKRLTPSEWRAERNQSVVTVRQADYDRIMQMEIDENIADVMSMWTLEEEMVIEQSSSDWVKTCGMLMSVAQVVAAAVALFSLCQSAASAYSTWSYDAKQSSLKVPANGV